MIPSSSSSPRVRFDRFELDLETGELWREGKAVDLPRQPSRILTILVGAGGSMVERSDLRRQIWGEAWLDWESALHQSIRRIRVALGDSATAPRFVETLPRRGYRFIATIDRGEADGSARPIPATIPVLVSPTGSVSGARSANRFAGRGPRAVFAGLAVAVLAALPFFMQRRGAAVEAETAVAPEAVRLHREGLYLLDRGAVLEATARFRRAAAAAPAWSAPWSAVAETELARADGLGVDQARIAIERALARDPDDAHAWRLLGRLRLWEEWDWVGARGALDRAAEVGPEDAEVWQLIAALETVLGRERQAIEAARRALALDPISTGRRVDLGWTLYYLGRGEQALAECRRGLELDPASPWARQCVLQALLVLERRHEAGSLLGDGQADSGAEPVTAYFERQLATLDDDPTCASSAAAAIPKIVLGDREGALDALVAGAGERRGWEVPFARVDPLLAALRREPRFSEVERALGAPISQRAF